MSLPARWLRLLLMGLRGLLPPVVERHRGNDANGRGKPRTLPRQKFHKKATPIHRSGFFVIENGWSLLHRHLLAHMKLRHAQLVNPGRQRLFHAKAQLVCAVVEAHGFLVHQTAGQVV